MDLEQANAILGKLPGEFVSGNASGINLDKVSEAARVVAGKLANQSFEEKVAKRLNGAVKSVDIEFAQAQRAQPKTRLWANIEVLLPRR